jgi:hypothetical protein
VQELPLCRACLHIQCHTTEERTQGQSSKSALRASREPAQCPTCRWLSIRHQLRWSDTLFNVCASARPSTPRTRRQLPRILLRQRLSLHTRSTQTESTGGSCEHGTFNRGLLSDCRSVLLRHDTSKYESIIQYAAPTRACTDVEYNFGPCSSGRVSPSTKWLRLPRKPNTHDCSHIVVLQRQLLWISTGEHGMGISARSHDACSTAWDAR